MSSTAQIPGRRCLLSNSLLLHKMLLMLGDTFGEVEAMWSVHHLIDLVLLEFGEGIGEGPVQRWKCDVDEVLELVLVPDQHFECFLEDRSYRTASELDVGVVVVSLESAERHCAVVDTC